MALAAVLIIAAILFLMILVSLGFQPKFMARLIGVIILVCGIAGIFLYGYGYYTIYGPSPVAVMRTLFSVFCMYLGRNEISAVSNTPLLAHWPMQILLYLVHLGALYATASSVVASIGVRVIRALNLFFINHKDLILIYGANDGSVSFGEQLQDQKKGVVVFVDSDSGDTYSGKILRMGSLLLNDESAKAPDAAFLRKLGVTSGSTHLSVYCLDLKTTNNLRYAESLLNVLKEAGIESSQTDITLLVPDESAGFSLQAMETSGDPQDSRYGYGSVNAIETADLIARLAIRKYPPYAYMGFGEKSRAAENFESVIIGFGRTGQAMLRYLLMNGQFEGSEFRTTIVADKYSNTSGSFFYKYPGIKGNYKIDLLEVNARSSAFYEFLSARAKELNYIVVCTGNDAENAEISKEITDYLRSRSCFAPVLTCSEKGVDRISDTSGLPEIIELFTPEILCSKELDQRAMLINHEYHRSENNSVEKDWQRCDYFSRLSCRASADFLDAMIHISGLNKEDLIRDGWPKDPALLENLARTEHLRWCAFHYAFGYRTMDLETFAKRGERYRDEVAAKGRSELRIGKDTHRRLHACLVPWEDLEYLGTLEAQFTGTEKDYQQLDLDNVLLIPRLLKEEQ